MMQYSLCMKPYEAHKEKVFMFNAQQGTLEMELKELSAGIHLCTAHGS